MALVLNEEQQMLRDSAQGFLAEKAPIAALRALRDADNDLGFSAQLWQDMVDMGWAGIAIDEQYGGLGYGYTGLGLILEQMGRTLSASPLQSTVLLSATAIDCLASDAQKETLLPAIAAGSQVVALAVQEGPHFDPQAISLSAAVEGGDYILNGTKHMVLDGCEADQILVIARTAAAAGDTQGLSAFMVAKETAGMCIERTKMVDSRSAATVSFDNVRLSGEALLGEQDVAWEGLTYALNVANIGLASELLGLSCEAFERTVEYLKERQQFGKVIGSFQGLAHRAAHLFAELELARSIVLQALQGIDAKADNLSVLASAAKAKLCEVAELATNEAIQMHGGIGMTDEFDIGFYIKRARVVQHSFGDYNYHLDRYAALTGF